MKSVLAVHFWLLLCFDVSLGYPAIERPQPTENDVYSHRGVDDGAQFVVPEGVELPTREGRVLKTTTVEDVKAWMADTVADNDTASQSILLSYAGKVERAGDILTLTAPNGKVFTFDLAKYSNVIEDVTILEIVKTIIVNIRKIGKAKRKLLSRLIDALEAVVSVYVIEADSEATLTGTPADPLFMYAWHMRNAWNVGYHTNAEASWKRLDKLGFPKTPAVVAVIDSPVDITHQDLTSNLFSNPNEKVDGTDTDQNGCVDDVHNCYIPLSPPTGAGSGNYGWHGTHVAGIIAAASNNHTGLVGVAKSGAVQVVSLGFDRKYIQVTHLVLSLDYVINLGAKVSNNSYGFKKNVPAFREALKNSFKHDHLFVAAINNSYHRDESNPGTTPYYPAWYRMPNVLVVTSIDIAGTLSDFAGFGKDLVHLGAPGTKVVSTLPHNGYGAHSGTSMATPMVTGAAAQLRAAFPDFSAVRLVRIITQSARKYPAMEQCVISGGALDADRALLFGQCEVAFTEARATCKAKASESDKEKYVSAGAKPEEAEKYALHCEGTAAVLECIQTELKKTKEQACYRRTCDIAEGQCDDSRADVTVNKKLPVMRLGETCKFGRLFDSVMVTVHIKASKAKSHREAMLTFQEMLTEDVLRTNEEVVMDAVVEKDGGYDVSGVVNIYG